MPPPWRLRQEDLLNSRVPNQPGPYSKMYFKTETRKCEDIPSRSLSSYALIPGGTQGHRQEMLEGTAAPKVSLPSAAESLLNCLQNWQAFIHACIAISSCTLKDKINKDWQIC
ncbi:hypothetical protein LEMLEM_LOCUS4457 [Lemmus lemmus]